MDKNKIKECKRLMKNIELHDKIIKRLNFSMQKSKELKKKYLKFNKDDLKELSQKIRSVEDTDFYTLCTQTGYPIQKK